MSVEILHVTPTTAQRLNFATIFTQMWMTPRLC